MTFNNEFIYLLKVVKKKVNMMIKSHLQGRDEKERWQAE